MLSHFSLFSGIGGIDIAAEHTGFTTVGQCEINEFCRQVLDKHWPDVPKWGDIFELTGQEILDKCGRISLLSGGFPCQPFSVAGKRKGKKDERHLWPEFYRIICEVKPRWVLAENVRGLLSIDAGRTFGRILKDLAESGYSVGWLCYGAKDVGAPHKRERVLIVAHAASMERKAGAEIEKVTQGVQGNWERRNNIGRSGEARKNVMAHAKGAISERHGAKQGRAQGRPANDCFMAYPDNEGSQRYRRLQKCSGEFTVRKIRDAKQTKGKFEPPMGGMPDGFSTGMDGNRWPTGPCEQQYGWEPPRTITGLKNRAKRLKALGNAVVPAQVYPILKAIADIEKEA